MKLSPEFLFAMFALLLVLFVFDMARYASDTVTGHIVINTAQIAKESSVAHARQATHISQSYTLQAAPPAPETRQPPGNGLATQVFVLLLITVISIAIIYPAAFRTPREKT